MVYGLPDRLRTLRQQHGFTQRQLADSLNISPSVISAYETGGRSPSIENLMRIAAVYRCSTDYLLGITDLPPVTYLNIEGLRDEQVRILQYMIRAFREET